MTEFVAFPSDGARRLTAADLNAAFAAAVSPANFGAAMLTWLLQLPPAPQANPGWWNNAGIPTYS